MNFLNRKSNLIGNIFGNKERTLLCFSPVEGQLRQLYKNVAIVPYLFGCS